MPFVELLYLTNANDYSSVFVNVPSFENLPGSVTIDGMTLIPTVTFMGESRVVSVCNVSNEFPDCGELCASLDMYLMDHSDIEEDIFDEIAGTPDSCSSRDSDQTDCSTEDEVGMHCSPDSQSVDFLKSLAQSAETFGIPVRAYRSYGAQGLFRFDFQGDPKIVNCGIILFRKLATELADSSDVYPCFDIPDNLNIPWCKLVLQVIHTNIADETTVTQRITDNHAAVMAEHDYMFEETLLTDVQVKNGVVVDSRYLASENPHKIFTQLMRTIHGAVTDGSAEEGVSESKE